jgi:hypothetical protein
MCPGVFPSFSLGFVILYTSFAIAFLFLASSSSLCLLYAMSILHPPRNNGKRQTKSPLPRTSFGISTAILLRAHTPLDPEQPVWPSPATLYQLPLETEIRLPLRSPANSSSFRRAALRGISRSLSPTPGSSLASTKDYATSDLLFLRHATATTHAASGLLLELLRHPTDPSPPTPAFLQPSRSVPTISTFVLDIHLVPSSPHRRPLRYVW